MVVLTALGNTLENGLLQVFRHHYGKVSFLRVTLIAAPFLCEVRPTESMQDLVWGGVQVLLFKHLIFLEFMTTKLLLGLPPVVHPKHVRRGVNNGCPE